MIAVGCCWRRCFNKMTNINRGSEWRKWDLHIHSIYSTIVGNGSYKGITDGEFIEKILEEKISVV